ncbi:polysaccharide biosynthesis tyrosine autokinase [Mariniflexile litorale]|uniref:non-specific protein-tyrosine kinase n=1 Tax=Mariniflexile litorale TaxID=3045158 RepID=A0AAU7EET3_9FLAO|nr:polysaccharide biosynthesis tyrosine autokinase [Mariniflexile sp. KMM 9835]MDQ8211488.1 polysaccharide biosynthesis tyrosine autokinase [Mariniflexile sp. KMM 9835]
MMDINNISKIETSNSFNLKKMLSLYFKQWKWFVLSCFLCLVAVYFYLRYTTPQYSATAKIMLISENDQTSPLAALSDLSPVNSTNAEVEDEILVIKSKRVVESVVKSLNLNVQYFTQGLVLELELYKNAPIDVSFIVTDSLFNAVDFNFFIDINTDTSFEYRVNETDEPIIKSFGENISTYFGSFVVTPKNKNTHNLIGNNYRVKVSPVSSMANELRNKIEVYQSSSSSKILDIYFTDPIPQKATDIIDGIIYEYDIYTTQLKNIRSKNTADFIDSRVQLIASDLVNVDDSIVRFKTGNKLTDVSSEAGQFLNSSVLNEQALTDSKTQLRLLNYMNESLETSGSLKPIPSNLGMGDPSISALSSKYNELLASRERLLKSAGEKNTVVVELDQTLSSIKQSLGQSINNSKKTLNIQINSLENQLSKINSKIFSVPGQESKLRGIERKQGIKESLYLYLLQKREEAAITLTSTAPNLKILDEAYYSGSPISPNKKMMYLASLFLGLIIPFGIIYLRDLLDAKIHNKEDLEKEIKNITVLGEIPKVNARKAEKLLIEKNDRSILSESFRIVRTNFDYVRRGRNVENYENVVFVTSTINGEGKSFFSINTALTLANTNKRVLLIGADIRNPQIHSAIKNQIKPNNSGVGLTEYLVDKSILVGETINTYTINDIKIDILLSGKVPPNPAELLMSGRIKELFDYASNQYDIVIVDTAPAMLVTDTLLISQYAGHTIYLTRAGYTEKQVLNFAKELHASKKLNGMMLVVNDVSQANFGYGAKYGYYGAPEKNSFLKKIFK